MRNVDITLLLTLDALLTEGSVTAAADRLNLSVPATSRRLAHLRDLTHDELFVLAGRKLVPTARALDLRDRVQSILEELHALFTPNVVSFETLNRTFSLRTSDGFIGAWSAELAARIRREAPHVKLCFYPHWEGVEALRDRSIDLEITVLKHTGPEVFKQKLFQDHYVGIAAAGHPLAAQHQVSPNDYVRYGHVSASRRGQAHGPIDHALAALGLSRDVSIVAPDFQSAISAVAASDLLGAVPASFAKWAQQSIRLHVFPLPVPTPGIEISQAWHPRSHGDVAHRWLRNHVRAMFT
ncbi:hypothetical protein AC629_16950 [Bradyrhizobium sp. NAS80.1]|uniref:LysR family transcriptional regulator n=1 Tax=Bradyrhizobium sp. NAS80.1 TaxID=1680159 RepID=UPI00095CD2FB|nr:LysR family transcriptional regulator [Bradyrhizobium sp. NAS80.1]OKO86284.1 hypothetical protein AC629_16950 [Bradyrhizobium sp. NAS80.1]